MNTTDKQEKCVKSEPTGGKERFLHYYGTQQSLFNGNEWEAFTGILDRPLPTTFWVNPFSVFSKRIDGEIGEFHLGDEESVHLKKLNWLPNVEAWAIDIPRKELRKNPQLSKLHSMVVKCTEAGMVWRQEEVSMLPPMLLSIEKGDRVLDMCAAPGSKTAQLLTLLGKQNKVHHKTPNSFDQHSFSMPADPSCVYEADSGYVVANETDLKRLDMLIYRMKRLHSVFPYAIFTNHDARYFPSEEQSFNERTSDQLVSDASINTPISRFNKILCDVPCTGDGTIRKNPHALRMWNEKNAFLLNPLQLEIAFKACKLLEVGGTMVYSTCSINPIENEAVVHHLLRLCGGSMVVVDPEDYDFLTRSENQAKFKVRSGMSSWYVNASVIEQLRGAFTHRSSGRKNPTNDMGDTYSPPSMTNNLSELSKTIRIYPHDQNTGGFYIAVLKKVKPLSLSAMEGLTQSEAPPRRPPRTFSANDTEHRYIPVGKEMYDEILAFYSFGKIANILAQDHLISHKKIIETADNAGTSDSAVAISKTIGFVSKSVYEVFLAGRASWNIVNAGLRLFTIDRPTKQSRPFSWRICNESVELLIGFMEPRLHQIMSSAGKDEESRVESESHLFSNCSGSGEPSVDELFSRVILVSRDLALELLNAPQKSLKLESFAGALGDYEARRISGMVPGSVIFLLKTEHVIGFSGIVTNRSVQASVSNTDLSMYIDIIQCAPAV